MGAGREEINREWGERSGERLRETDRESERKGGRERSGMGDRAKGSASFCVQAEQRKIVAVDERKEQKIRVVVKNRCAV